MQKENKRIKQSDALKGFLFRAYHANSLETTGVEDPEQQPLSNTIMNGFTLIELLIVVLIIGILAAIALPQYQKAVEKARAAKFLPLLNQVYLAEKRYYLENGVYTMAWDQLDVNFTANAKTYTPGSSQFSGPHNSKFTLGPYDVTIRPNTKINYYIGYYFNSGWAGVKVCRVTKVSDTKAIELCKSLTGRDTHTSGSIEQGVLQYTFPETHNK